MSEEEIRKNLILEMIVDKLFNALKKTSNNKIKIENYYIDEDDMTYLLQKYDVNKFNEYKAMLLKGKTEEDE